MANDALESVSPNNEFDIHIRQKDEHYRLERTSGCLGGLLSSGTCLEIRGLFTLAWPTVFSYFFYHLISMITLFFAGRLGEVELAAGTLAISFVNVTGPSLFTGLSSALETLGSQAVGAKNYRMAGIAFQRGIWILGIVCILTWALWINAELLLLRVEQKRNVSHLTQEFTLTCIPASIAIFMFFLLQRYLQTQGVVKPILYVGAVSNAIQIGLSALMVYVLKWGFRGIAISWSFTNVILFLLTFVYMKVMKLDAKTWPGWTIESLLDWGQFIKLAVAGMVMICIEWWSFEIGSFLAGSYGEYQLATYGVIFQWAAFHFMIPLGISIAAGVRVGNALGAGDPAAAKRTAKVAIGLIVCIDLVVFAIFFGLQDMTGRVFTDNSEVLSLYTKNIRFMSAYFLFDGVQGVCSGIVRGSGRQTIGVLINFVAYCCIGLPCGITLMFLVFHEITGLWIGLGIGVVSQASLYVILLWKTDWERQAQLAKERTAIKAALYNVSETWINVEVSRRERDAMLFSWIYKTSSLPFLSRYHAANNHFELLTSDENKRTEYNGELECNQEESASGTACDANHHIRLTSSEKKSLILKRLIPLGISLLILGAAVFVRFFVPLPPSYETVTVDNKTVSGNITGNFTTQAPIPTNLH